jgi:hypothetical protein
MTTKYNIEAFTRGKNGFGLPFCDTIFNSTLAANTERTLTVPSTCAMGSIGAYPLPDSANRPAAIVLNKFIAVIACTPAIDTFIAVNATAAVPVGNTFAASTSELVPQGYIAKYVKAGDVIHVISGGTPSVSISFYAVQE